MYRIEYLVLKSGKSPFLESFEALDESIQFRIAKQWNKFKSVNLGHVRFLGSGVYESKQDYGGGIRIYFGKEGHKLVLLILCGNKSTQSRDIFLAKKYWNAFLGEE